MVLSTYLSLATSNGFRFIFVIDFHSNLQKITKDYTHLSFLNSARLQVGTLYHKDRMAGRKLGAALITANISKVM